ncbi:MAG TPA: LysM domain-containing protein [Candidatus Paceibacterota bacterium]
MTSPGMFIDGYIPAQYSSALTTVNANDVPYWRSLSRPMSSDKWEILKINFRQAVLITDISFNTLKISHEYNVYYTNRNDLLIPVVLSDNSFFEGVVQTGDDFIANGSLVDVELDSAWEKIKRKLYPIVAKSLEIRMRRIPDSQLITDSTYRLGIRKLTLRRTIATEHNKYLAITDSIDAVGNFVTKTFLDWEPEKATDNNEATFWKSAPQPSPNAVVSFYLDTRNQNGDSSPVDKVWIDPTYAGQQINLYYSNDDTESTSTLSTVAIAPTTQVNVGWTQGSGLNLQDPLADLRYAGSRLGMIAGENLWIALAFSFSFDSSATVGSNLTLFNWDNISIIYNDSTKKITFQTGSLSVTTGVLSFSVGDHVIVILQLRSLNDVNPGIESRVYHDNALASHVTLNGNIGVTNFNQSIKFSYSDGFLAQALIKRGSPTATDISQFVASPQTYVSPDPVIQNGDHVTSTTLDNAVFGGDFFSSRLVFAGSSFHRFSGKTWSPIWANYVSQKGYLTLPQQIDVKYIKLEFTKLTPEPYPVVDQDIEVSYRQFPISFSRDTVFVNNTYTATSLDSRMGVETKVDPNSIADKFGLNYGPLDQTTVKDVQIQVGDAVFTSVPHTFDHPITDVTNVEPANSKELLNKTEPFSETVVQSQSYTVVKGDTLIGIAARYGIPDWHTILDLNIDLLNANVDRAVNAGYPRHTAGWWIFPGQNLRISTAQTQEWTNTTTVTESTTRSTVNNKFTITSVHEYDIKKVKRDAAIAYFAGLKEVRVYREDFTVAADSDRFEETQFQIYDDSTYSTNNVNIVNSNSVVNLIKNPNFAMGLQGINDAGLLGGSYNSIASVVLSNDFAYSGTISAKITYGASTGNPQGVFIRLYGLPASAYVGYTYQTYTVASGVWTKHEAVSQASVGGQVDLLMVSPGAVTPGGIIYLDAIGAYIVKAANSAVPKFFDGDFAFSEWHGFAGESSSVTSLPTGPQGYYTSAVTVDVTQRTNLVTNPSFETNTTSWASGGTGYDTVTSIARDTGQFYTNTASLLITWKAFTTKQGVTYSLSGLTNGATYVAMARVKNGVGDATECFLECGGATGYTSSNLLRGQWQRLEVRWTQSGTTALLALASGATTATDVTYLDTVAVFRTNSLYEQAPDYFDGGFFGNTWSGTAHASTSLSPTKGIIQSPVFNTWSQFRKVKASLRARPLETLLSGLDGASALGVGAATLATWEDPLATWADATASWGAAAALATVDFTSNYVYNGVNSIWIHRGSSGIGGVFSAPITPFTGAHVRAEVTVFLPSTLDITNTVKIVDQATKTTVYLQETITSPRGGWQTYVTNFIISDGTQICIDIESNGSVSSDLYIADMSIKQTTITMLASNDTWNTQLDLDDLVWKNNDINGVFAYASNKVQVKFEMLRAGDWISGYSVTPYYLS